MSELKITQGEWKKRHVPWRGCADIWCIDWSADQEEVVEVCHGEDNATLIEEAGNVFIATGLTPRELVEQRDALLEALEKVMTNAIDDYYQEHDCDGVLKEARAALRLARGKDQ